jgi:plasmid stability protein
MANISVKDVPEQWAQALRQRAARNHRSLQGELMFLIEQAVQGGEAAAPKPDSPAGREGRVVGFDNRGQPIVRRGWKTVEQVVVELNAKYPGPITDAPLGVDIIRADRDSR